MLKKALVAIVAIIIVANCLVLLYAATKPDTFRIEYATRIDASPEKIFPYVNNLASYRQWSPWEEKDPDMKGTLYGPAAGKGAAFEWAGNSAVGVGRMEILESEAPSKVVYDLHFKEPFDGHHTADIVITGDAGASTVTWAVYGDDPFFAKVMTVFFDREKMIVDDFRKGLDKLKALAEK
jgi:uncharacterized protein YndB with AHSA1/START domain